MALSNKHQDALRQFYNALSDRVLTPDDPVYVAELNARSSSVGDPIREIATEISWQEGGGVCLFTGQRGTGKSTELRRLEQDLRNKGMAAFYSDMSEYILLTKPIEISDFVISMAGALSDRVTKDPRFQLDPSRFNWWDRFVHFMKSKVELTEISGSLSGVEIKAALKSDPHFKQRIQQAARGHVTQLVSQAHEFFAQTVTAVRESSGQPDLKIVLIVDSVERIRGLGDEAMGVYESVRNLFFGHAESLRVPLMHVVYTVPPYLSVLAAGAGALMGGANVRRLVNTHVVKEKSRDPDQHGLEILRTVIARRHGAWRDLIDEGALDDLSVSSGGDLRELFRMIRYCLPAVRDDVDLPLTTAAVARAKADARNEMLPIPSNHLAWLKEISQTHETCLDNDANLPVLAHFLDNRLVMNYRNGADWYDVHPLLREVVDAYEPRRSTS